MPSYICDAVGYSPIELLPGDSVVVSIAWVPTTSSRIAPGAYRLVPSVSHAEARNSVDVTVVPPAG